MSYSSREDKYIVGTSSVFISPLISLFISDNHRQKAEEAKANYLLEK